jgi:hypothetical protein
MMLNLDDFEDTYIETISATIASTSKNSKAPSSARDKRTLMPAATFET